AALAPDAGGEVECRRGAAARRVEPDGEHFERPVRVFEEQIGPQQTRVCIGIGRRIGDRLAGLTAAEAAGSGRYLPGVQLLVIGVDGPDRVLALRCERHVVAFEVLEPGREAREERRRAREILWAGVDLLA